MFKLGGWKRSSGNLSVQPFEAKGKVLSLANPMGMDNSYIIPEEVPVYNQLLINSCVANATCMGLEVLKYLENPSHVPQLSRLFLYWNARLYTKETNIDEGTFIHNCLDSLTRLGVCEETIWPYDSQFVFTQPNLKAYREGNDNKITTFYQILTHDELRLSDIERAIRANHPVIFGTAVGEEFLNASGDEVFSPPKVSKGNHAMLLVGVRHGANGPEFLVKNSWGTGWGNGGYAWLSAEYMIHPSTGDLFVPTRMPDLLV